MSDDPVTIEMINLDFTDADGAKTTHVTKEDLSALNKLKAIFNIKKVVLSTAIHIE